MVELQGRVVNCGQNIFPFEERIIGEDFLKRRARAEQLQNVYDTHALAANTGAAAATVSARSRCAEVASRS